MITNFVTMFASSSATSGTGSGLATIFKPLYWSFGKCMEGLLGVFNHKYFLALIVFTVLTRLVLFPLTLKQQKTTAKTARLQPKIQKIQKKYAHSNDPKDRQKQQEEIQELYNREGHNPLNMGCGPMVFQMIFLMGIIGIIYYPLTYILNIDLGDNVAAISELIGYSTSRGYNYPQLALLQSFTEYKTELIAKFPEIFTTVNVSNLESFISGLNLFGIDMTEIPDIKVWSNPVIIIPIFCLVTSMGSSLLSTFIQKKTNPAAAAQGSQMMIMMLMMPLFSFYISFKVPAAVGFYWIISNLVAIVQQLVMAKFFPPKRNIARQMIESTIERRSREESIKNVK